VLSAVGDGSLAGMLVVDIELEPVEYDRILLLRPPRAGADDVSHCWVGFE